MLHTLKYSSPKLDLQGDVWVTLDSRLPHRLSAVCFADIVGYSRLTAQNKSEALRVVGAFQDACGKTADLYGGRVVKFMGDGALIEFSSTEDAARAAAALFKAFEQHARSFASDPPSLRVGLHLGEVARAPDGDIYGEGLNIAARLQQAAAPGQVLASEDVWRQLRGRPGFRLEPVGERELKGYDVPVTVYDMVVKRDEGVAASETLHRSSTARSMAPRGLWDQIARRRTLPARRIAGVGLGLLLVLLAWRILSWSDNPSPPDAAVGEGSPRAVPFERSIAVLPFSNIGGSQENEYFSDGMTDEIVANLAKIDDLRVVSRTSVMQYKGTTKLVGEIAEELGVSKILEGSVRRAGDRVRITAQLIEARTDVHLWAESYERQLTDVLEIQAEIALEIATQLEVRLSNEQLARFSARPIANPTAYDFYLRANEYLQRQRPHDIDAAIALFQEVIGLDSDFAPAHAGLAMAYVARYAVDGDTEKLDHGMRAARRALDLDPALADGQAALGDAYLYRGQNRLARQAFLEAVELEPNHADAMGGLVATSYVLGRYDEALIWAKRATAIEPTSAKYPRQVGFAFTGLGDFEQSDLWLKRALQIEPDNGLAYGGLALNAILRGEPERAEPLLETMVAVAGDQPRVLAFAAEVHLARRDFALARSLYERVLESTAGEMVALADLGFLHLQSGDEKRGRELLDEAAKEARAAMSERREDWMPAFTLARIHSVLGRREDAYRYLETAIEGGWHGYYDYGKDPLLDPLRRERRFHDLMQAVKDDIDRMRETVTAQTVTTSTRRDPLEGTGPAHQKEAA